MTLPPWAKQCPPHHWILAYSIIVDEHPLLFDKDPLLVQAGTRMLCHVHHKQCRSHRGWYSHTVLSPWERGPLWVVLTRSTLPLGAWSPQGWYSHAVLSPWERGPPRVVLTCSTLPLGAWSPAGGTHTQYSPPGSLVPCGWYSHAILSPWELGPLWVVLTRSTLPLGVWSPAGCGTARSRWWRAG